MIEMLHILNTRINIRLIISLTGNFAIADPHFVNEIQQLFINLASRPGFRSPSPSRANTVQHQMKGVTLMLMSLD